MPVFAAIMLVVIRVYDACGIDPASLVAARHLAADTLARAGIEVNWISCGMTDADGRCAEPPRPADLLIRIVPTDPPGAGGLLGSSYLDSTTGSGSVATLYFDRIKRIADAGMVDHATVLGRALAHETGHLLLATNTHSVRGLMRAIWTDTELRRQVAGDWQFSITEAARLRAGVQRRSPLVKTPARTEPDRRPSSAAPPVDQSASGDQCEGELASGHTIDSRRE